MIAVEIKIEAGKLRRQGKSYNEISRALGIQKSTIAYWLTHLDWSQDIKTQLTAQTLAASRQRIIRMNEGRKRKLAALYRGVQHDARKEYYVLHKNPLFIAGLTTYWGEGDRILANGQVKITNVDYRMLVLFRVFLETILIYPDLDANQCLKFWSTHIKIDEDRFHKAVCIQGRHPSKRLPYGVCAILVSNKCLKTRLLQWLELFAEECAAGIV